MMVTLNMATPEVSGMMVPDGILKTQNIDKNLNWLNKNNNYEEHTFNPVGINCRCNDCIGRQSRCNSSGTYRCWVYCDCHIVLQEQLKIISFQLRQFNISYFAGGEIFSICKVFITKLQ